MPQRVNDCISDTEQEELYAVTNFELWHETAQPVSRCIKAGETSTREVMENALAVIETVNVRLNCFCFVFAEQHWLRLTRR